MSKRRVIIPVVLVLAIAAIATLVWWYGRPTDSDSGLLTLYGNVELRDARLAFTEQERVAEVLVDEGQSVERGEVLARLESALLRAQLDEAAAQLAAQRQELRRLSNGTRPQEIEQAGARVAAAEVRASNAERLVRRLEDTTRTGASTEQDLDDARSRLEVERAELVARREALDLAREGFRAEDIAESRARLEARQAQVRLLEERLARTALLAPGPGVIRSRILEPGEIALPSRPAFVIALADPKWVRAYLPEPQLGQVREGAAARIRSDSFPDRPFTGWVGFISPQAEFTPKSVETTDLRTRLVYETRIWVEDPDNELRLGMPVTVQIDTEAPALERAAPGEG